MSGRRLVTLTLLSAVLAAGEFLSAVIIALEDYPDGQPAFAVAFGCLFLVCLLLLRSGRISGGAVMTGVLCLFEVVSFPGWQRHNALDWTFQVVYAALAATGLALAILVFVSRRRASARVA